MKESSMHWKHWMPFPNNRNAENKWILSKSVCKETNKPKFLYICMIFVHLNSYNFAFKFILKNFIPIGFLINPWTSISLTDVELYAYTQQDVKPHISLQKNELHRKVYPFKSNKKNCFQKLLPLPICAVLIEKLGHAHDKT